MNVTLGPSMSRFGHLSKVGSKCQALKGKSSGRNGLGWFSRKPEEGWPGAGRLPGPPAAGGPLHRAAGHHRGLDLRGVRGDGGGPSGGEGHPQPEGDGRLRT